MLYPGLVVHLTQIAINLYSSRTITKRLESDPLGLSIRRLEYLSTIFDAGRYLFAIFRMRQFIDMFSRNHQLIQFLISRKLYII